MVSAKPTFDELLAMRSRVELRNALAMFRAKLSLPQCQQLASHASSLEPEAKTLRLGIVHSYTSDLLDPWLTLEGALQGLSPEIYHAPFGVTFQEAHANSGLVQHRPDVTLMLLRREDIHPALALPITSLNPQEQEDLRQAVVFQLTNLVGQFREQPVGQIVLTLLPSMHGPGLGVYDAQSERSEASWWASVKDEVGVAFRTRLRACTFLDLDEIALSIGKINFFDHRYWYSSRFPFTAEAARELSRRVMSIGAVIKHARAKVIVLDADNTLWGGVIGEDGMTGIGLGPDYPGSAYVDFQRRILDFQQRGFILALCSKNNPNDLDQVLREHPHQVLREEHFAAKRVNWEPKPDNLKSLAEELNLGLDSFVFVDDSHHECAAVRHALPQVEVIQTPSRAVEVPFCLDQVARLEILSLTDEDLAKTEMYAQDRRRRELKESHGEAGNAASYLESLRMKMRINLNCEAHLARLSQLTQKTNQFNLTTRRYDEQQMQEFIRSDRWLVADFSLADIFGDSGTVGLAIFDVSEPSRVRLDSFLMSCRVIGRNAESAFLYTLLGTLADQGKTYVVGEYIATAKNSLVKNFLSDHGFQAVRGSAYTCELETWSSQMRGTIPIDVEVVAQ